MKRAGIVFITIMVFGIIPIQHTPIPTTIPHAYAATNANLFVSAENSQWNNYFAGPQVIQVVVADPDINRLDQAYGEPVVTVNGKRLRMAQATDGNWYGYFADRNQAIAAGNTAPLSGKGLNFGGFCSPASTFSPKSGVNYADTKGFTLARGGFNSTNHTLGTITSGGLPACTNTQSTLTVSQMEHVVRQNKTLNNNRAGFNAAAGSYPNVWPIIQLYDFSAIPSTVTVDYQKSGGDQIVNLTFDRIPQNLITATLDRNAYPQNSQVFVQVNDPQLNIDPTEDDSWTWGVNATNNTLYYEAFTRNGAVDADGTAGMQNLIGNLTTFMFNHNGKLTIQPIGQAVRVVDFQANDKIIYTTTQRSNPATVRTNSIGTNSAPLTMIETGGVNTGVFADWDSAKKSEIVTVDSPTIRGQSATVRYNDISTSIVGGFSFASISQTAQNNTWASGQRIPVTLTDSDDNKNGKLSERMFLWDPTYKRSTAMVIGTPFTLSSGGVAAETAVIAPVTFTPTIAGVRTLTFTTTSGQTANATTPRIANLAEDELFSARPIFNFTNSTVGAKTSINSTHGLLISYGSTATFNTMLNTIHNTNKTGNTEGFKGFNFINYDLRSFSSLNGATGSISNVGAYLVYNNTGGALIGANGLPVGGLSAISLANSTNLQSFINLNGTNVGLQTGVGTSQIANPALINQNLFSGLVSKGASIGLLFTFTTSNGGVTLSTKGQPVVADFFSVGLIGDGSQNSQRINNGIYRYELEETGDNTGVFTGTNQYVMINQLNIYDPLTYFNLRTIQHDVYFPAIQDMLQSEARAPQITYYDLGQDGVNTQISAQQDIPTHTGVISFDSKTYKIGDTVGVTLWDGDLNVNNDLIDIYTVLTPSNNFATDPQDIAVDTIGMAGLGTNPDGSSFGSLLEIAFGNNDIRWSNSIIPGDANHTSSCTFAAGDVNSNTGTAKGYSTSLSATGFTLVETGPTTGIFTGTFEFPDQLCQSGAIASTAGMDIKAKYFDFADRSGRFAEKEDSVGGFGFVDTLKIVPEFATFTTINQVVPAPSSTETVPVVIFFRNTTAAEAGIRELSNIGLVPAKTMDIVPSVSLSVTGAQLNDISNKFVVAIFRDEPVYPSGMDTVSAIQADLVGPDSTGNGIKIAVIDTGIDLNSRNLQEFSGFINCMDTFGMGDCSDTTGHGTHVAGIALASGNPDNVLKGVAPKASLLVAKVFEVDINGRPNGVDSNVATGIDWAVNNGANVINISLENPSFTIPSTKQNCDLDPVLRSQVGAIYPYVYAAVSRGIPVVAASGNHALVSSPACISDVIAVGAVDGTNPSALFKDIPNGLSSATGAAMADHGLVAPGVNIKSTWNITSLNNQGWKEESGTSMAAPAVSGTIALILDKYKQVAGASPPLTPELISQILFDSANAEAKLKIGATFDHNNFGNGLLNVPRVLNKVDPTTLHFEYRKTQTAIIGPSSSVIWNSIPINAVVSDIAINGIFKQPTGKVVFFDDAHHDWFPNPPHCLQIGTTQLSCDTTYIPQSAEPRTVTASYVGDTYHDMSSGSMTIQITPIGGGASTDTHVEVNPQSNSVKEGNTDEMTAIVSSLPDGTTPIISGTVTFTAVGLSGGGFSPTSCNPSGSNDWICTSVYTAPSSSKGDVIITATYSDGSAFHTSTGHTTITVTDCMIATAAFGSALAPQVELIRHFRNHSLLQTIDGSSFMIVFNTWYYSFSPSVADFERSQPWFQQMVRMSIYPLLDILTVADKTYTILPGEYGSLSAGLVASSLIGALYFWPFAVISNKIRNNTRCNYKLIAGIFSSIVVATICSIILGNQVILMATTTIFVISAMAIFATLSASTLASIYKRIKIHI